MTDSVPPRSQYIQVREARVRRQGRQLVGTVTLGLLALQLLSRAGVLASLGLAGPAPPGPFTAEWLAVTLVASAIGAAVTYGLWLGIARLTRGVFRDQAR